MLDAESFLSCDSSRLVSIDRIAYAAITDCVGVHLKPGGACATCDVRKMFFLAHQQSGVAGIIVVRREQRGAAAA